MRNWCIILFFVVGLGTTGALQASLWAAPPPSTSQDVAAQVNGRIVTYQDLNEIFLARTRVPFETVQENPRAHQVRKQILEHMVNDELITQEAERQKLSVAPELVDERLKDIQARFPSTEAFNEKLKSAGLTVEQLKEDIHASLLRQQIIEKEILEKVSVSPDEVKTFFDEHKDDYVQEESVRARHILIKLARDASREDDQKAKDRAKAVLARAKKGEDFAGLATQYSEGPTKEQGGDLGYFGRGKMVKPFSDAAFQLKVGEISDLVRSEFGYHLIKVEDRKEAKRFSFEEAKDQVKTDLRRQQATALYQEYVKGLREKAAITINLK